MSYALRVEDQEAVLGEDSPRGAKDRLASEAASRRDGSSSSAWPTSGELTDDEAAEILAGSSSGLRPDLSRRGYRLAKRAFDIVASGAAIALLLLPGLALSAVICAKSPGAGPLYGQVRVGRLNPDGTYRLFRMWKFRSMVPNADRMLDELKDRNEADGPLFKIKDDPRVIPGVGQFIRRHSLDELPQLINVFLGDMSLIGPRPALPGEVVQYDERARRRLTVKCGCGGPWQAGSRSDGTFDEMVDLDLDYVERCSTGYDLRLMAGTVKAMITGEGAY
ncbi:MULTISPECIES: sugar transferase [unclassified Adlercreutzia]|uniref:sugar transferase n=1 Tax=unclassified Adlercreutzia TaxID=2636013 RepID=UPI0013EC45B2|nr:MULTISPECIES: sugar transferase [unclassified Adlercreutzia]